MDPNQLVEQCLRGIRSAQKEFYEGFAPFMLGVCVRYLPNRMEAEDAMIQSMHKALTQLDRLRDIAMLKGWLRRIAVNECLMILRKKHLNLSEMTVDVHDQSTPGIHANLEAKDLLSLLAELPLGYRTIFNLYVLEGYTHKEIGELLGISLNTSKSQLIQARKKLAALLGKPMNN